MRKNLASGVSGSWCPLKRAAEVIGDRWSLLIIRELASGPARFKSLKENISGISMDQLSRKLDSLCENHVIVRQEFSEIPPRVEYQLTEKGVSLLRVLRQLIAWGAVDLWGPPRSDEIVDIALTLRTMAAFFGTGAGVIEIRVRTSAEARSYLVIREETGRVSVNHAPDDKPLPQKPDACLELSEREFIKAISQTKKDGKQFHGRLTGDASILRGVLPMIGAVKWTGLAVNVQVEKNPDCDAC